MSFSRSWTSFVLFLRMLLALTLISFSLPVSSFRLMTTPPRAARSVKPPAWAMAWRSVGIAGLLDLEGARVLDLAEDIDGHELVHRDVDDVARFQGDVELGVALEEEVVDGDAERRARPVGELADDDDVASRVPGQAAGLGDDLHQRLAAEELVGPGLLDRPEHGDPLALVFADEDGHLGVLDIFLPQELGQLLLELGFRQAVDEDLAEERQGDLPVLGHADRPAQLLRAEDADLEEVLGTDPVLLGELLLGRQKDGAYGKQSGNGKPDRSRAHVILLEVASEILNQADPEKIPVDTEAGGVGGPLHQIIAQLNAGLPEEEDRQARSSESGGYPACRFPRVPRRGRGNETARDNGAICTWRS